MLECHFRWCRYHHQDIPMCSQEECIATHSEIELYRAWQNEELEALRMIDGENEY